MSSEMRKHHQFVDATLQNTADVLQMPEVMQALGNERTNTYTGLIDRFYQPNLKDISSRLGRHALVASTPRKYRDTDMLPIVAAHTDEQVYLHKKSIQMYQPPRENMITTSKVLHEWAGENTIFCCEYLESLSSGQRFVTHLYNQPFELNNTSLARVILPGLVMEPNDNYFPYSTMHKIFLPARPFTMLSMDYPTKYDTPAKRSHPAALIHETQHLDDDLSAPVIGPDDKSNRQITTELKSYQSEHLVYTALGKSAYDGAQHDTLTYPQISYLIELLREHSNPADDPYAASDLMKHNIIHSRNGRAFGLHKEADEFDKIYGDTPTTIEEVS